MIGQANAKWRNSIDNHDRLSMSLATKARKRGEKNEKKRSENNIEYEEEEGRENGMVPSYSGALQTFSYWNVAFQHSRRINGILDKSLIFTTILYLNLPLMDTGDVYLLHYVIHSHNAMHSPEK